MGDTVEGEPRHARELSEEWYSVRCVYRYPAPPTSGLSIDQPINYEERITVWRAQSFDDAVAKAEVEAIQYAEDVDCEYLGFAQAYRLADDLVEGAEVFSLIRASTLAPKGYLDNLFDTGTEFQRHMKEP